MNAKVPITEYEWIDVALGEMVFSPVQYNSFRVGPFSTRVRIMPGETSDDAFNRGLAFLRARAREAFRVQSKDFMEALREINEGFKSARRG